MEEKNEMDKIDDVILPGFRFHPTDEELVDFYLKRKIQQQPLSIELIKQVDIYKYDPWDLPKELASTGEKEWYFYCPRDRKYRNSTRPNRVTRAGFWKATGTDRPIYSSDGKCIGLKKSLVFYRGRAAKGIKTDWMMHEFRLPSLSDSSASPKKLLDKTLPPSDSWAICKIFKKNNSMSMAQKALSHSWMNHLPESMVSDILNQGTNSNQFMGSENISCTTEIGSSAAAIQFCGSKELHQQVSSANLTATCSENINHSKCSQFPVLNGDFGDNSSFIFSTLEGSTVEPVKCAAGSMILNPDYLSFEGPNQQLNGFSISVVADEQECSRKSNVNPAPVPQWEITGRPINGFPFSLPPNDWKPTTLAWDSPSPPCPSDMSTNRCYT